MIPGLSTRALALWAGTDRLSMLPNRLPVLVDRPITQGSAMLALCVAGAVVPRDLLRGAEPLITEGLVELDGPFARATVAIIPLRESLLVCDRLDTPLDPDHVCWPDDSSHHLAGALPPGRVERWLDLGCGSAFAPLARPELARAITGLDVNARAVRYARVGAKLSRIGHLEIRIADVGRATGTYDLVTCNAPIPDAIHGAPMWQTTTYAFFERLWETARRCVAPGGTVVVHAVIAAIPELPGEVIIASYAPDDEFGILWWRPDAPARRVIRQRALTRDRPHVDANDREPC